MKTFTLEQIREDWKEYETKKVMRVMVAGAWKIVEPIQGPIGGIKAQRIAVKEFMKFPDFLESKHGK